MKQSLLLFGLILIIIGIIILLFITEGIIISIGGVIFSIGIIFLISNYLPLKQIKILSYKTLLFSFIYFIIFLLISFFLYPGFDTLGLIGTSGNIGAGFPLTFIWYLKQVGPVVAYYLLIIDLIFWFVITLVMIFLKSKFK